MNTTRKMMWVLCGFYIFMSVVYIAWTMIDGELEWVGAVGFPLMAAFTAFIGYYMGFENKPFAKKLLPEDREDAEIADADPELGFFAPQSIWPIILAAAVGAVFASIAFGWWPAFFFAPFALVGLVGWMFEFYRGRFGH